MAASSAPTVREVLLVSILFISLLYFSPTFRPVQHADISVDNNETFIVETSHTLKSSATSVAVDRLHAPFPPTQLVSHAPGWSILDSMYMQNGTWYIVTDTPSSLPPLKAILSKGINIGGARGGSGEEYLRVPDDKDLRVISTTDAQQMFGRSAHVVDGLTFVMNDSPQFITHYYHFCAELFFGVWRTYISLMTHSNGTTNELPPPKRILFPHLDSFHWRDYANMNQLFLRSLFPSVSLSFSYDFADLTSLSRISTPASGTLNGNPIYFERLLIADRSSAMPEYNYLRFQRTAAVPFGLPGRRDWWSTVRDTVVSFAGVDPIAGSDTLPLVHPLPPPPPHLTLQDLISPTIDPSLLDSEGRSRPVITYVSRQEWNRRKLIQADHDRLVAELYKLRDTYGYEVNVVSMDKLSRWEQIRLAARTTILCGVHGNGLTALLWMKPTSRSTVIEFFFPGGFAHDYEYTARAMGITHYGFWGNNFFTSPGFPLPSYPEGFQGNSIPIDGAVVANLIRNRLALDGSLDEG